MARTSGGTGSGSGGISKATSTGGTIAITDPTGPTTNLEVAGGGGNTGASEYITEPLTLSANTVTNIASLALAAGTWLVTGTVHGAYGGATLATLDAWLTSNPTYYSVAYASGSAGIGAAAGGNKWPTITVAARVVLADAGSVYLNVESDVAAIVEATSTIASAPNATGLVAVPAA